MSARITPTRFGFIWGNLHVERCSEEKGTLVLWIGTQRQQQIIRITRGGKIIPEDVEKVLTKKDIDAMEREMDKMRRK